MYLTDVLSNAVSGVASFASNSVSNGVSFVSSYGPTAARVSLGSALLYSAANVMAKFDSATVLGKLAASVPQNTAAKIASAVVLGTAGAVLVAGKFPVLRK